MAKEHEIVAIINNSFKSRIFKSKKFQLGSIDDIAEQVKNAAGEIYPGSIDFSGDVAYLGIDDTKPFQIYHRVIQPSFEQNEEEEFGDRVAITEITNMRLVVIGDRSKLELTAEDIKSGIAAGFPLQLTKSELNTLGLTSGNITPVSVNWNREDVYRSEYNLKDQVLKTTMIIFSVDYQIQTTYDQTCFTLCN